MVSLKLPPPIGQAVFGNKMGKPFFLILIETLKKNCNYIVLLKKSAFRINFGHREVGADSTF